MNPIDAAHAAFVKITPDFSVRTLRWLPVITAEGLEHVGLDEALVRSNEILRIETRDPIVRAALNRFLISTGTLVARAAGVTSTNAPAFRDSGFPAAAIEEAFSAIDAHLWLSDEFTPFMQLSMLSDLAVASEKGELKAAELLPRTPGASQKAWFDVAGGAFNDNDLTPEAAVIALVAHWYYSPKSNSSINQTLETVDEDGQLVEKQLKWRSEGSIGLAGAGQTTSNNSLTFWHRGRNLTEFVLLNIAPHWLEEDSVPAWASCYTTAHDPASLAGSTWTGNAVLLGFNTETKTFTTVIRAGHPDGLDTTSAKVRAKEQLAASSLADPSRVWTIGPNAEPVLFRGFELTNTTAQNLRSWFLDSKGASIKRGVLLSTTGDLDVLAVTAKAIMGMQEILHAGWINIAGRYLDTDDLAGELVAELADSTARKPESELARAIAVIFPNPKLEREVREATTKRVVALFHGKLEAAFGRAIAQIVAGEDADLLLDDVHQAKLSSFDEVMAPLISSRSIPEIAMGRARLRGRVSQTHSELPEGARKFVGRFIRQVRTDTAFRVELSRGAFPDDERPLGRIEAAVEGLPQSQRDGVIRALGILSLNHRLSHAGNVGLSQALANLTRATGGRFDGLSGVGAKVSLLPTLDLEQVVPIIDGLMARAAAHGLSANHYDVVNVLRQWDQTDLEAQSKHRNGFVFSYYAAHTSTESKAA
jgi:hypothetical protein